MSECVSGVGRRAREWAGVVTGKWSRTVMATASVDYELIKLMVGKPACFDRVSSHERERQFRVTCVFFRFLGNVVADSWLVPILIDWCLGFVLIDFIFDYNADGREGNGIFASAR